MTHFFKTNKQSRAPDRSMQKLYESALNKALEKNVFRCESRAAISSRLSETSNRVRVKSALRTPFFFFSGIHTFIEYIFNLEVQNRLATLLPLSFFQTMNKYTLAILKFAIRLAHRLPRFPFALDIQSRARYRLLLFRALQAELPNWIAVLQSAGVSVPKQ